jgi:hypothetical protein
MHPTIRIAVLLAFLAGVAVATGATTAGAAQALPCRGRDVAATFTAVRGSAGAGQISYVLRLRNRTVTACWVSGLAGLRLLGRTGRPLPTHVRAASPGALTAVRVVLAPGGYAAATARFSPDVPGPGEGTVGRCEPTAYRIRVTPPPGGGTAVARVVPATPVCEHGRIFLSALIAGRKGPNTP